MVSDPRALFGAMDIYLLDQLLRGRIAPGMKVLEVGCGHGRNLAYFLRAGYDVFAADSDETAIDHVRRFAADAGAASVVERFRVEDAEAMTFPDGFADVVISSAVLHFARDDAHFLGMLHGTWRALRPGGLFFCRLASTIGMEGRFRPLGGRRFGVPDGSERYLVDEEMLLGLTAELGGTLGDPLKTTVVQDQRCMTTWVARRADG